MESLTKQSFCVASRVWMSLVVAFFFIFLGDLAVAQDETEAQEPLASEESEALGGDTFLAPVIFEGETIFFVRGSTSLPAKGRAERVSTRIYEVAEQEDVEGFETEIVDSEFGLEIRVNGTPITIATQGDAEFEQMEIELVAALQAQAIKKAIEQYREDRTDQAYVDSAIEALFWTVLFVVLTTLFFWKRGDAARSAASFIESRYAMIGEAAQSVVKAHAVASVVSYLVNVLLWVVFLVLLYLYLSFVLLAFPETRVPAQLVLTHVSEPVINVIFGFIANVPNVIMLVIIVIVTRVVIKGLRLFLYNVEAGTVELENFEHYWIKPTFFLGRLAIILVAIVFAYPFIPGSDSTAFKGLTILAGVVVSIGSNSVIANLMAGLFVMYRRSTVVGDRIEVDDTVGDVVEITFMETLIKSTKNELISIPNSQLLNSKVRNFSKKTDGRGLLVHTTVGIGYEEPPEKVIAMLVKAAELTTGLKKSPTPFVLWNALGDYSISYEVNAYTARGSKLPEIMSDLHENIVKVFNANGTQIMTPSYISDPANPKIPVNQWSGDIVDPTAPD